MVRRFYARKYGGKMGRGIGMRRSLLSMKRRSPKSYGVRCFPLPAPPTSFLDRERKRFLAFARNDEGGEQHSCIKSHLHGESVKRHSPSFPWKEVVRRGVGWHRSGMKVVWGEHCLVSSSRAEPRDLFRLPFSFSCVNQFA